MHSKQSAGHVTHVSPRAASQKPFMQVSQVPQSCGQLVQFSVGWHVRSPQLVQMPQSC
jgi:hypothetical protein